LKKVFFILLLFTLFDLYSEEAEKIWKVAESNDFTYKEKNVELISLSNAPLFYELKRKILPNEKEVDLYISFDEEKNHAFKNYKVISKKYLKTENRGVYKNGGHFTGDKDKIELAGNNYSFFQSGVNLGDFSVSFWIYPVTFSGEETILKIGSQYYNKNSDTVEDESIVAKIKSGKIVWEFNNLFKLGEDYKKNITLIPYTIVEPEKWSHIALSFDSSKGILREFINGEEVCSAIATDKGDIDGSVMNLRFHPTNRCVVRLGASFCGAVDEFLITKSKERISNSRYEESGGEIYSNALEVEKTGAYISKIICDYVSENNSEILFFFRGSEKVFYPDEEYGEDIKWHNYKDINKFNLQKIRYIQFKILLLPGENQEYSPKFRGIKLVYEKNLPPSTPIGLKVLSENGTIKLKWFKNSEKDLKGYKIYYGVKSGNYFCEDSINAASPIDAGLVNEYNLTNLKKNILYYISLTAYDDNEGKNESPFSKEIICRVLGD